MSEKDIQQAKHLCSRAGFGLAPDGERRTVKSFFKKDNDLPLDVIPHPDLPDTNQGDRKKLLKEVFLKSRENMMKLNLAWMEKLRHHQRSPSRKNGFFWHNHFACRN
jgi:hypothetical protein